MKSFDTTPRPAFLLAMQNQKWSVAGALGELIDNSFGPARGNAGMVTITFNQAKRTLEVLDNGRGVDQLHRVVQLGNTIGRGIGDIGLYGSGGSMALLWLADKVDVWSLRDGLVGNFTVDWKKQIAANQYPKIDENWRAATAANTPPELFDAGHGTLIRLKLQAGRRVYPDVVQQHLSEMFAPGLRQGKPIIWRTVNGTSSEIALSGGTTELHNVVEFVLEFEVGGKTVIANGRVGYNESISQNKSKIAIGFGARVIMNTAECFGGEGRRYHGTGISGWIDLGEGVQPLLSTAKDDFNDKNFQRELMSAIFEQIKPLLEKVQKQKINSIFADLKVNLEKTLQGKLGSLPGSKPEPGPEPDDADDDDDEPANINKPKQKPKKPSSRHATKIEVLEQSDSEMCGAICRSVLSPTGILVSVNVDHSYVKEAMEQKPFNRAALRLMIAQDVAAEMDARDLMKEFFSNSVARDLGLIDDRAERERLAIRKLVDAMHGGGKKKEKA
jgi:hypothetical protein